MDSGSDDPDGPPSLYPPRLEAAVRLAARGHHHQFRKHAPATDQAPSSEETRPPDRVPYVTHLMGTMSILARLAGDDDVLAAGVLHDYLEDVPDPDGRAAITAAAGPSVLALVEAVTEERSPHVDKAASWETRKHEQLDRMRTAPDAAVLIKTADVLHNMVSLLVDLAEGDNTHSVWQRLNAGPDRQLWYFDSVIRIARERLGDCRLVREAAAVATTIRQRSGL